ncbi:MAG: hypothetical protein A2504_14280 [Bdellovibrionales bacterium RIFOXYD12_FULL_39_22]|nr:MAG: hypothetical protein A2385_04715 [Bdellovibrionales bacterium RIFOXYB1_FULL_39_21]OFZ43450.1 MAG: hypothetical protein A2485_13230 [Bdellovibrionales bacterium RIFOXYC12_FULL_39_17]OFZ46993.1 MAG: hypothetical protein A2404_00290 [Bdellovibrionales bacterium RIFOXYC1_FULL_39_130]OFZ73230.1 MAG: hypothetical protein A2451_10415 [Bdellovibrionales bacterium RIFOXYC2_FULL_39_8]OFZ76190.1 MAG: hypothetical protein A2560_07540 [Bdellovibrionales bacterium RIFOXYD1_FULL_39_84]OFZ94425.1 MAG:
MTRVIKKILVIDDEEDVLIIVEDMLLQNNFQVVTATSLAMAKEVLIKDQDISLVVSDINLGSFSGIDFYKELKKEGICAIPFIFMSGYVDSQVLKIDDCRLITKPFSVEDILAAIRSL